MKIKEIMTRAPVHCSPDTKLDAVAKLMLEHDCGEIPICDGTKLIGVVTDRDIAVRGFVIGKNPLDIPVRSIMTSVPFTITANSDTDAALELMERHQVRRLPVISDGQVVGMVSQADLISVLPSGRVVELLRAVSRRSLVVATS